MKVFKPPHREDSKDVEGLKVFLGGSIEMGKAEDWQRTIENEFSDRKVTFFNPRRDDWDSSWEQSIENEQFRTQVMWELDHIIQSDIALFFIAGETKSPITLMEIGLVGPSIKSGAQKGIICCEPGFWRKGNVEVFAYKFDIPLVDSIEDLIRELGEMI